MQNSVNVDLSPTMLLKFRCKKDPGVTRQLCEDITQH